jgi:hypothetical protein
MHALSEDETMKMLFEDVNKPEIEPAEITINTLEELIAFIDGDCNGYVTIFTHRMSRGGGIEIGTDSGFDPIR